MFLLTLGLIQNWWNTFGFSLLNSWIREDVYFSVPSENYKIRDIFSILLHLFVRDIDHMARCAMDRKCLCWHNGDTSAYLRHFWNPLFTPPTHPQLTSQFLSFVFFCSHSKYYKYYIFKYYCNIFNYIIYITLSYKIILYYNVVM